MRDQRLMYKTHKCVNKSPKDKGNRRQFPHLEMLTECCVVDFLSLQLCKIFRFFFDLYQCENSSDSQDTLVNVLCVICC